MIGLYLHTPFCISKCAYCDFYSFAADEPRRLRYVDALCRAIGLWGKRANESVGSIYFGGGTPSLLGETAIGRILAAVRSSFDVKGKEITVEVNPASGLGGFFEGIKEAGVNRVSIGLQSADEGELLTLGRIHTAKQALDTVKLAKKAGISHISLDVMLAIPGQTRQSLINTLDFAGHPAVDHISAYLLKVEPNTPFGRLEKKLELPGEEFEEWAYLYTVERLREMGYAQYEISNFCKPGGESGHNLRYWNGEPYLGIGPGAYSFYEGRRSHTAADEAAFVRNSEEGKIVEVDDGPGGDWEEYAMLRLRLAAGLDLDLLHDRYGVDTDGLQNRAQRLTQSGLTTVRGAVISLTARGFLLSNSVIGSILFG